MLSRSFVGTLVAFVCLIQVALAAPGVQQSASQTATISGTVLQSDGSPIAGASVRLAGPAVLRTQSDSHGYFQFTSVPFGSYLVVVDAPGFGRAEQQHITVTADTIVVVRYHTNTLATIVVHATGAHLNETAASVASITPTQYAFQGNLTWVGMLENVPGVTVGGNLFGGGSTNSFIPDSPFQPQVISINGAQPYETSTTFDGMPMSNVSFSTGPGLGVDLSALPMALFESADVVRGPGADAPSIVDSVGGSLVLHPPGFVSKNSFEGSFSNDEYGGYLSNMKAKFLSGKLSATIAYGFDNSPGPLGSGPFFGAMLFPGTIGGNAVAGGGLVGYIGNPAYGNCFCLLQSTLIGSGGYQSTAWSSHNGGIGLSYQLTPSITMQTFYAGSQDAAAQADILFQIPFTPGPGYGGPPFSGTYIGRPLEDAPTPIQQSGSLTDEKITAYFPGGAVLRLASLQNFTYYRQIITNTPPGPFSLFGTAALCPAGTILDNVNFSGLCGPPGGPFTTPPVQTSFHGQNEALTFLSDVFFAEGRSTNADELADFEAPIGLKSTAGISYIKSNLGYTDTAYDVAPSFGIFETLGTPVVTQTTDEARLHVQVPLATTGTIDASYYMADATFHVIAPSQPPGSTCNTVNGSDCIWTDSKEAYSAPRLGATWHLNSNTVLRGSVGGGFALPQILALVGSNGAPSCSGTSCIVSLTNTNLQPEKSFGFDVGTDARLRNVTTLSVDLYRTDLYGQFFNSANLIGTDPSTGLPLYTEETVNLAHSRYEGIDLAVRDDAPQGVYWNAGIGLTRGFVLSVPAGFYNAAGMTCNFHTGSGCQNTYVLTNQNFDGEFESTQPYANGSAEFGYRWAQRKYLGLQINYQGNNNAYFQPAFASFDAHASYPVDKQVSLLFTLRNLTNVHGQSYQLFTVNPNVLAPSVAGTFFPLYPIPIGPRTLIVTTNVQI